MSQTTLIRRPALVGAVIAGLAAGALAVPVAEVATGAAEPASAAPREWVSRSSPSTTASVKAARVTCPDDMWPYSAGGAVEYAQAGAGGAALTAIVPDVDARAVIVTAEAPANLTGEWSVRAIAVCVPLITPVLVVRHGSGSATARCPEDNDLFGVGFRVVGEPSDAHVTGIDLKPDQPAVQVTAGGPGAASAEVTAVAICRPPGGGRELVHARTAGPGWPKTVSRPDIDTDIPVYATAATVVGPEQATLDAVVPGPDEKHTWARGTLFGGAASDAETANYRAAADDEDSSVTLEVALIGTFH